MAKAAARGRKTTGRNATAQKRAAPGKRRSGRPARSGAWVKPFLLFLERDSLTISGAAKAAGIARSTVYDRRDRHEKFGEAIHEATQAGLDALVDEVVRRARPHWVDVYDSKGHRIGKRVDPGSDLLLLARLNSGRPGEWKRGGTSAHVEITGEPKKIVFDVSTPSDALL